MTVKDILNKIRKDAPYKVNSYDTVSELSDLLKDKDDKFIDSNILGTLFRASANRRNYNYYYSLVIVKLNELFPDKKTQIPALYTQDLHFSYMKTVLAEYLSASTDYKEKTFDEIIASVERKPDGTRDDATGFSKLEIDPAKFLNGSLTSAPSNFPDSWDALLDILAGKDVNLDDAVQQANAKSIIEGRLSEARSKAAGVDTKSLSDFLETAGEEQLKIFKKNFEQSLLIETSQYCAKFRETLRWFELYDIPEGDWDAYKKLFKDGKMNATKNQLLQRSQRNVLPYGGRICPITFQKNSLPINNLKTHPFSWMFFRDISNTDKVVSKLGFYKMVYRDGKQYEVGLPVTLPKEVFGDAGRARKKVTKTDRFCSDGSP